ncbi:hypothetical protein E2320_012197 [Naja naja]|nr:hypothetical protein E2320_012197 [Naja naja]
MLKKKQSRRKYSFSKAIEGAIKKPQENCPAGRLPMGWYLPQKAQHLSWKACVLCPSHSHSRPQTLFRIKLGLRTMSHLGPREKESMKTAEGKYLPPVEITSTEAFSLQASHSKSGTNLPFRVIPGNRLGSRSSPPKWISMAWRPSSSAGEIPAPLVPTSKGPGCSRWKVGLEREQEDVLWAKGGNVHSACKNSGGGSEDAMSGRPLCQRDWARVGWGDGREGLLKEAQRGP